LTSDDQRERDGRFLAEVLTRHASGVDDKLGKMVCNNDDSVEVLVVAMLLPSAYDHHWQSSCTQDVHMYTPQPLLAVIVRLPGKEE
jgi:hypothetical protein